MNLENPDTRMSNEVASLTNVALESEIVDRRRRADTRLVKAGEKFAMNRDMRHEFQYELMF